MLRLVTSPPVVLMVALVVCGQVHAGTSPPNPSQSSTTEQTSYQVLQAILKHDDPIRTIGRINQRFVLLTEKKNLFDLPASAWDNSSHKLKLDNVTTVEKHWPQLLSASPIALDPPDQSTLLAFHSVKDDQLLWIRHQAGSCLVVYNIATGVVRKGSDSWCGQPGLESPSTRYISSSESARYFYTNLTQSKVSRMTLSGTSINEESATNCTSPLNYTVGFQDGAKYYLFSSQADHLDIVDMATCQIESLELSSFFVCTPDPTTPTPMDLSPSTTASSTSIGLIVGIVGGVIVALLLIGLAVWCLRSGKKHKKKESKGSKMTTSSGSAIKHGASKASGSNRKNSKLSTGSVMSARTKGSRGKASHVPSKVNASKRKASKAGGKAKASKVK